MSHTYSLTGRLGHDPEVRITPTGKTLCRLSVADNYTRKLADGTWEDVSTTWVRVTCWGELAEAVGDTYRKGDEVHVTGRVSVYADKTTDDEPRGTLEVTAFKVFGAPPRRDRPPQADEPPPYDPADSPF